MPDEYYIRAGYTAQSAPEYFVDDVSTDQTVWQPDVYLLAAKAAEALGSTKIVDVGCGRGEKLSGLSTAFSITGIDFGANIDWCRTHHDFGVWVEHDLDHSDLPSIDPHGAVVICSDVIKHVRHPHNC